MINYASGSLQSTFLCRFVNQYISCARKTQISSIYVFVFMTQQPQFFNPLTPNDPYSGRTTPLTSKVAFYIFIQQI